MTEIEMAPFRLESFIVGGDCAVLQVAGEVDVYTVPEVRDRVIKLIDDGAMHVLADLRQVTFLDSTGLGMLIGSLRRVRARDGSLTLVCDTGRILKLFRVTALDRVFVIRPTAREAITADQHWRAAITASGSTVEEWCRRHDGPR
jgi:anti-sigma B factor antagonist